MKVVHAGGEVDLGRAEATPTITMIDFSRRETDEFGVTRVVPRGFSRRMSVRLALASSEVDTVHRQLAELRATVARWVVDAQSAWLDFDGFYRDFEVDLALPPLSYCTLEVESLAQNEAPANPIGDPAPGGTSTLRLVKPVDVTAAMLTSSVPEADHPEWSAGISYAQGARVIKAASHRIYESAVAGNLGNDPSAATGFWIDIGPTNRWAMLDEALGTATAAADSIVATIDADGIDAVAFLDVAGTSVRVQTTGYNRLLPVGEGAVTFLDLPLANAPITITVSGTGTVSVGTLVVGQLLTLGKTEAAPKAAIIDYSRKETDDFGEPMIVERAWAKRMSARALLRTDAIDLVADRLASVRARPALWIGDDAFDSLIIYGFAKEFTIERAETVSTLSLSIEGLSRAAAAAPSPLTAFNPRGEYDAAATYAVRDVVVWPFSAGGTGHAYVRIGTGDTFAVNPGDGSKWAVFAEGGEPGADGAPGTPGEDGAPGAPGAPGMPGEDGVDGVDGQDGKLVEFVWARAPTKPAAPVGNGIPAGWSDEPPADNGQPLWMSKSKQELDGTLFTDWSEPIRHDGPPGTSPYQLRLTNEDHTVPADADGNVTSYAGAEFSIQVFHGDDDVTAAFSLATSVNPQNLNVPGTYPHYAVIGGLDANEDAATLTVRVVGTGLHSGVQLERVFSLSKSRAGQDGADPPLIRLTATQQIAKYDSADAYVGGPITFTAVRDNIPADATWSFAFYRVDNGELFNASTAAGYAAADPSVWTTTGPDNLTFTAAGVALHIATYGAFRVVAYSDGYAAQDSITITKVRDGSDGTSAYSLRILNDNSTVPADAAGNVLSYAPTAFTVQVFHGSTDVTGSFIWGAVVDNPQGLSLSYNPAFPNVIISGGLDAGEPTGRVTVRVLGTGTHAGVNLDGVVTIAKSKAGADGSSPPLITLEATSSVAKYDSTDAYVGGPITFNTQRQNIPTGAVWAYSILRVSDGILLSADTAAGYAAAGPTYWSSTGPDNLTLSAFGVDAFIRTHGAFRMVAYSDGYPVTDSITITKVKDGANGAQGATGPTGAAGAQGPAGADGQTLYTWIAYANNANGTSGFTTGANTGQAYIGIANNKTTPAEGSNPADYTWSLIKGTDGAPGSPGADGSPTYTWLAYSTSPDGTANFTTGAPTAGLHTYLGLAANKSTPVESTNPADYFWSLIRGADGFGITLSPATFVVPTFASGAAKPSWTGGSCIIRLNKGGVEITSGVTYSFVSPSNIATPAISGQTFTFADATADKGEVILRATYLGVNYDQKLTVTRVKDGDAAFRASAEINGPGSFSATTTVPSNRPCTVSAVVSYTVSSAGSGTCKAGLTLYWRNVTDGGAWNLLGFVDGTWAERQNRGTQFEPDWYDTPGACSAGFGFTSPTPDKQIAFRADFAQTAGSHAPSGGGSVLLAVS